MANNGLTKLQKMREMNRKRMEEKEERKEEAGQGEGNLVDELLREGKSYEEVTKEVEQADEKASSGNATEDGIEDNTKDNIKSNTNDIIKEDAGKEVKEAEKTDGVKEDKEKVTVESSISSRFRSNRKEKKTVRKSFLIKESYNEKLRALAEELGTSENDLINQMLEMIFDGE
ncbi:MAG: hypothetical protein K5889_07245 [Lachnospiraceae bacterium]|nr:hypothetical protein [Lachnospiraceae bacterium]